MSAEASTRSFVVRSPGGLASARLPARPAAVAAALAGLALLLLICEVGFGSYWVPPGEVVATIAGSGAGGDEFVVMDLRLPRALTALLAGAALALGGAVFQTLLRNPLASPDIIGISGGAGVAGVAAFLYASAEATPFAAFGGALLAAALLFALSWGGGLGSNRMVLIGIALSALAVSATSYLLTQGRVEDVSGAVVWLVGSVNNRIWSDVTTLAVGLAVLLPALAVLSRSLDALAIGDEWARSAGVRVDLARLGLVGVGAALVAIAIAAAGPIGFVALMAPNIGRRLARTPSAAALPAIALTGGCLVVGSDLLARVVLSTEDLPVGVVTSILGGPFFLYLLLRGNRVGTA